MNRLTEMLNAQDVTCSEKQLLSRHLSRLNHVDSEPDRFRFQMEQKIQQRTCELIKANNRLQLEVLERDRVEAQTQRKTRLLDAVNLMIQQSLSERDNDPPAVTFLESARQLTHATCGFVAELHKGRWQVLAIGDPDQEASGIAAQTPDAIELDMVWRKLRNHDGPLVDSKGEGEGPFELIPKGYAHVTSYLLVPLCKEQRVCGFIALFDKSGRFDGTDQADVNILARAFTETLLQKWTAAAKRKSEKRLNLALEMATEGMWDFAPHSGQIFYSPRWFTMLGYETGDFPDTLETWYTLTHPEDLPILEATLNQLTTGEEEAFKIEIRMLSASQKWYWLQVRGRTVEMGDNRRAARIVGTLIDISKYKEIEIALQKANCELKRLAALDDMTQIANRRRFDNRLAQEWSRGQREEDHVAVILCDIDYFKKYNDTFGHLKGDQALYAVAQTISAALKRPTDLVARFGGEEFAMILPSTDIHGARRVALKVKEAIAALGIVHRTSKVNPKITLSFGCAAMIPQSGQSSRSVIEMADKALYHAKFMGRNQIFCEPGHTRIPK